MLRNLCIVIVLTCVCAGCAGPARQHTNTPGLDQQIGVLVEQIITGLTQSQATKLAVIPFADLQGNDSQLGRYIAEELTTKLYQAGRFEVVERTLLEQVIAEQKLGISGFIDDDTAISLGKILGVDALATGTLSDLGTMIKVNARLIETTTGKVVSAASVTLYKDATLLPLLGETPLHPATPRKTAKSYKKRWMQFVFELTGTELMGTTLTCHFNVSNTYKQDATVRIGAHGRENSRQTSTHIYDTSGNQHETIYLRFGDAEFKQLTSFPGMIDKAIPAEMTIPMDIQIHDMLEDTNMLPMIQLLVGDYPGYKLIFKKVPVPL